MEQRIIVTGSQTSAIKAKRHLEEGGVTAQVVRAPKYAEGCRFGTEILLSDLPRAIALLGDARIEYTEIIKSKQ